MSNWTGSGAWRGVLLPPGLVYVISSFCCRVGTTATSGAGTAVCFMGILSGICAHFYFIASDLFNFFFIFHDNGVKESSFVIRTALIVQ